MTAESPTIDEVLFPIQCPIFFASFKKHLDEDRENPWEWVTELEVTYGWNGLKPAPYFKWRRECQR